MDEAAVRDFVERSRSILETSPRMDEENTKVKLIQPFIDLLGWDLYSSEVELEYPVKMGRRNTKVDYALQLGDTPVVFLEAKGCNRNVSDDDTAQLRSYMRQELAVDWGVVTNGKSFEVLVKDDSGEKREELSLVEFELDDLAENPDVLDILSKSSIESGKSNEIAKQMARTGEAITHLRRNRERIAKQIGELVEEEVGNSVPVEFETHAGEFIDDLVSTIEEQRRVIGEHSVGERTDGVSEGPSPTDGEAPRSTTGEEYEIRFRRDGDVIATFTDNLQSGVMGEAVDYLIDEHDLISKVEPLPYVPGRTKAVINDRPTYPDGEEEMRTYQEVSGGYYLDTHMNRQGKKREMRRLAERCDLDVEFGGDW